MSGKGTVGEGENLYIIDSIGATGQRGIRPIDVVLVALAGRSRNGTVGKIRIRLGCVKWVVLCVAISEFLTIIMAEVGTSLVSMLNIGDIMVPATLLPPYQFTVSMSSSHLC